MVSCVMNCHFDVTRDFIAPVLAVGISDFATWSSLSEIALCANSDSGSGQSGAPAGLPQCAQTRGCRKRAGSDQIHDGRGNRGVGDWPRHSKPRGSVAGIPDHQRHLNQFAIQRLAMSPQVMLPERFTVVRRNHDQRIVQPARAAAVRPSGARCNHRHTSRRRRMHLCQFAAAMKVVG